MTSRVGNMIWCLPVIDDLRKMFCTVRKSLESKGGIFAFSAEIVNECDESKLIRGLYCNHALDLHINAGAFDHHPS